MKIIVAFILFTVSSAVSFAQTGASGANYARIKADLDVVREDQRRLYGMIQETQKTLVAVNARLDRIEQRLGGLSGEGADPAAREQIAALRQALAAETQARKEAVDRVVTLVTGEIERLVAKINRSAPSANTSSDSDGDGAASQEWSGAVQGEYTVVSGDTLSTIAQAFGITTKKLMRANNLNDDIIRVGQKLIIPEP
jgi:LysM repeat protein